MASIALAASVAGSIATLPFGGAGFFPALVHHGFIAAAIGSLADWFAVTAIFKKPLSISYRTDILRRNRKRIMESIVTFAADDLLSVKNIMTVLEKENTADLFVDYLKNRGGRDRVKDAAGRILTAALSSVDTATLSAQLSPAVRAGLGKLPLREILPRIFSLLQSEKYRGEIIFAAASVLRGIFLSDAMQKTALAHISAMRREYEADSVGRSFVMSSLGLDDERILSVLNEKLLAEFDAVAKGEGESYEKIGVVFDDFFALMKKSSRATDALADMGEKFSAMIDIEAYCVKWLDEALKKNDAFWLGEMNRFIDGEIEKFAADEKMRLAFDRATKDFIEGELVKHHGVVPHLIEERLNEFSDDDLINFVETKVADDLQMIRVNGAIVGALAGMGLYVVVFLAERLCGA